MKNTQAWVRLGVAVAAAAMLAGCGGGSGSDGSDGDTAKPPASSGSDANPGDAANGTFSTSGDITLKGKLTDVFCAESNDGIQVTGSFSVSGQTGNITVVSGKPDKGVERRDGITIKSGDGKIYSRINSDSLPFDITDDGSKVTGSVVLADIQDSVKPNVDDRKQVTLSVDVDCDRTF